MKSMDTGEARKAAPLTKGPVGLTLLKMSASMLIGFVAVAGFNVTDTFFVARLGKLQLAAMGYTFPVVMIVHGLVLGLGAGTTSVLSRAIGEGDNARARKLTLHVLLLGLVSLLLFTVLGYAFMRPVFVAMGASEEVLPLVLDYMRIWFAGTAFVVIPMLGNHAIRATGDTLSPSIVMIADLGLNIVLDPIFIFGFGFIPAMGIKGAALATVLSRALALPVPLYILSRHKRILAFERVRVDELLSSWREILYIGVPAAGANMLTPLTAGFITRIMSGFGNASVAALSAGSRIEHFLVIPLIAMGASLLPFIGQNWGAREYGRVRTAQKLSYAMSLLWGAFCVAFLYACSRYIVPPFAPDETVYEPLTTYLAIAPFAIFFRGVLMCSTGAMNAINRPLNSTATMIVRLLVLQCPLAYVGGRIFGFRGVLWGVVAAEIIAAWVGATWILGLYGKHGVQENNKRDSEEAEPPLRA